MAAVKGAHEIPFREIPSHSILFLARKELWSPISYGTRKEGADK